MKHIIFSRCRFADKKLMQKYLDVSKKYFAPSLKAQMNKDFTVVIMVAKEDEGYIRDSLGINYEAVYDMPTFVEYINKHKPNIQTRHDIDDWMSPDYVSKIHDVYWQAIQHNDSFLIQAQPVKLKTDTQEETTMGRYHDQRTSMFLSLCQKDGTRHIQEEKHGWMWKVTPTVFTLPEGYVKWVIHGDNISCNRPKNWKFSKTEER